MGRARSLDAFQKLALITTTATYLLILVGGLVRASGAGLGCPDWPMCFGLLVPPTSADQLPAGFDPALFNAVHTWTEFLNRLLGASVGILILATLILAIARHRRNKIVLWSTVGAFGLVLYASWLGREVVYSGLEPWMVTAHLVVAIGVVTLLLVATAFGFKTERGKIHWPILGGGVFLVVGTLLQAGLGTQVRHAIELNRRAWPDADRLAWVDAVGGIDILHRQVSVLLFFFSIFLLWKVRRVAKENAWLERATLTALVLCSAQMGTGLVLVYLGLPPAFQVAHLFVGSLLLGAQTLICILSYVPKSSTET